MSKNKKILLATGIFPPDIGGPATYVKTLFKELPKYGFKVKVITYSDKPAVIASTAKQSCSNCNNHGIATALRPRNDKCIYRISREQNIIIRYFKYFLEVFKLIKWADYVYAQDAVNSGLPAWLACKLRNKKYFLKIVGDYAWEQGTQRCGVKDLLDEFQNKKYNFRVELWRKIQRLVARNAKNIIVPSNYLKSIIKKWGIEDNKIKVIYNSVKKIESPGVDKNKLKQELNISGDIIVSVGRLVPWKGFETLINIMPELLKINPEFKLIIAGEGPEIRNLELEIRNLELEDRIILVGALQQELLFKYMQSADIFVLNTGYEGLPHLLIEAMQLEIPVVTTKVGGNIEVVEDKKTGLLVEYNNKGQLKDAIIKLWRDKELAKGLAINAREAIKDKFSKERMISKLVKFVSNNL